jgi:subtilisin family serine protease
LIFFSKKALDFSGVSNLLTIFGHPKIILNIILFTKSINIMRLFYILALTILTTAIAANNADTNPITADLASAMSQNENNGLIRVNIRMKDQLNKLDQYNHLQTLNAPERRSLVVNELKSYHSESQSELMSFLDSKPATSYQLVRKLWIANVITAYLDEASILELSERSDIARIDIDEERQLLESFDPEPQAPGDKSVDEITYNVLKVNAPDVWDLGYTGEGVIVSVIDAGINYNHVDLADHMWESDEYPNHGYDFNGNDDDPMDGHGHGTHCAGTVASDGTAGSQAGMAPDATLMACKVLSDGGGGNESDVWAAIEFSVEQGAHVISMSLGWQHSWGPDRETWRTTYDNTLAAGVIASVAAGNEAGNVNNPDDVRTPGDCPPPWLHPDQTLIGGISAVVCVGSTDQNDNLSSFSSIGPSDWSDVEPFFDYPFNPEMGLLRPDVTAPGSNVKSCNAFNINGYTNMSGTSMATPGVAGVMALLLSKNPGLSPEDISMILETTALDLGTTGKDNRFGSGRIDALEAIENTSEQGPVYEEHAFVDNNGNGELEAGESVLLTLTLFNGSEMDFSNVEVTVSTASEYISMIDDTENYGDFTSGASVAVEEGFSFEITENLPGLEDIRFNILATDGTETWESRFDVVSWGPKIWIGNMIVDDSQGNNNGQPDPGEDVILSIEVNNSGQTAISDVLFNLEYEGEFLTFESTEYSFSELTEGQMEYASFNVNVSEEAEIGQEVNLSALLSSGPFSDTKEFVLFLGLTLEDWETADFNSFEWSFSGGDWFITDYLPYEGAYCAQSGNIGDNQSSRLIIEYDVAAQDTLSFFKKVSSEGSYDFLNFYIDDELQDSWSGEVSWSEEKYVLSEGLHTLVWEYSKDGVVSSGQDAAWVDYIIFPPMSMPSITMENMAEICEDQTYTSNAEVENFVSLLWTSSGDGTFDDETLAKASYTPGENDLINGQVELMLTAIGNNGEVHSKVNLYIFPLEIEAPAAPEGLSQLCMNPEDQTYTTPLEEGYSLSWDLMPSEAGALMAQADSVSIMWSDDFTGQAVLKVKKMSICAESEFSEELLIDVHDLPTMQMQAEMNACYGQEFVVTAELNGAAPWVVNIEGYGDLTIENSPMEMSWIAMQDSSIMMNWLLDANMCLNEEAKMLEVKVNESPFVNLQDSSICMNHVIDLDAGNPGATYEWSTGEASQIISVDSAGMDQNNQKEVSVWVTNEFDCTTEKTILLTFEDCSGISELGLTDYGVYPNPSKGFVELEFASNTNQKLQLEVMSLKGQIMYTETLAVVAGSNKQSLDLSALSPEVYFIVLKSDAGQLVYRIIIE